jgi:hypothetical protein
LVFIVSSQKIRDVSIVIRFDFREVPGYRAGDIVEAFRGDSTLMFTLKSAGVD